MSQSSQTDSVERSAPVFTTSHALAWLRSFEGLVRADADHLCTLVSEEIGKSEWEAFSSELMPLMASIRWHRRHAGRLLRPKPLRGGAFWQRSQRAMLHRAPVGTVGIIATWNYPIQLLGVQLVQAVVAGNRVVVKPSEHAPRCQGRLLELAARAGLDEDRLRLTPATREAGAELLEDPALDHVVFTGSTEVGRLVAGRCADGLLSSTLELSGRDSAIVLADADPELAADSIWNALVMNAGQTCMAPRRILVETPVREAFLDRLRPRIEATDPVRLVQTSEVERCAALVRDAVAAGGRAVVDPAASTEDRTIRPTAVLDCPLEAELIEGGHFGPVLAVVECTDLDAILALHGRFRQRLATSVFTRSPARIEALATRFGSGILTLNDCVIPSGHPAVPISGHGESGWGSSHGATGLLELTRPVAVSRTGRFMRLPTEVPGPGIQSFLRRIMRRSSPTR